MVDSLHKQAERLYHFLAELARGYQFRDREGICCHGISVSQCYTLDALEMQGPMTMSELAAHLHLEISSMTRVVDYLVANKLATRVTDAEDRRVCRVKIARKGHSLVGKIRTDLIKQHEAVLKEIPSGSREAVITAMSHLLEAFKERERSACAQAEAFQALNRVG
ncbi:MAG: MarR family transcriptional regulator [Phycisphaerales bacterium]|nr:MAG: MarR family transcriptional regulator [Phycisphaerales bacterium]